MVFFCCERKALSMWDQDETAPLAASEPSLLALWQRALVFRWVARQANNYLKWDFELLALVVLCWPLDLPPLQCSPVLFHFGDEFSLILLEMWFFLRALFFGGVGFFYLLPGFYLDNYKDLSVLIAKKKNDTFPVTSSLPDFRWAVKAFGVHPKSLCISAV